MRHNQWVNCNSVKQAVDCVQDMSLSETNIQSFVYDLWEFSHLASLESYFAIQMSDRREAAENWGQNRELNGWAECHLEMNTLHTHTNKQKKCTLFTLGHAQYGQKYVAHTFGMKHEMNSFQMACTEPRPQHHLNTFGKNPTMRQIISRSALLTSTRLQNSLL